MTLIRIVPAAVRTAGAGAVQGADALQTQAGDLRALPLPPMPAGMTAKYEAALDEVAARLVAASTGAQSEHQSDNEHITQVHRDLQEVAGQSAKATQGVTLPQAT